VPALGRLRLAVRDSERPLAPAAASDSSKATTSARPGPSIIAVASSEMSSRGCREPRASSRSRVSAAPRGEPAVSRSSKPASPTRASTTLPHPRVHASVGGTPDRRRRVHEPPAPGFLALEDHGTYRPAHRARDHLPSSPYPASAQAPGHKGARESTCPSPFGRQRQETTWARRSARPAPIAQALLPGYLVRDLVELDGQPAPIGSLRCLPQLRRGTTGVRAWPRLTLHAGAGESCSRRTRNGHR